ncbi:MAG: division/cell wall cluster transcriptional repressor MraZ [Bacillota bacterium]
MFSDTYYHQLDGKGRLRLPAKLRAELGGSFILMPGMNNTITIKPQSAYHDMCEKYSKYDENDVELQEVISEIMGSIKQVEEDSQGRFVIPQKYLAQAGIEKNVVIKGVLNRIEIWSEENHENRKTKRSMNEMLTMLKKADQNG